jgi:hypothetical protein
VPDSQTADRLVHGFLTQLSRVVQRASMYPVGHPAVGTGLGPLVEASRPLLAEGRLSVAVGRTRLLVASGVNPPTEHASRWLAARLFDKEIAMLTIEPDFDAEEASGLVTWLAGPPTSTGQAFPELTTVRISRFDGGRVRFREETSVADEPAPEDAAKWRSLMAALSDEYGLSTSTMPMDDPAALADRIRQAIHASEGTGIAALSQQLVSLHEELIRIGAASRPLMVRRLAELVEWLSPELRGSLLSVGTDDDDRKVRFVENIVESLPMSVVRDIVANLRIERTPVPEFFERFLRRLVRLSLADPALGEGLDLRFRQAGLPVDLFADGEASLAPGVARPEGSGLQPVPDDYRAHLDSLARDRPAPEGPALDAAEAASPAAIDRHVARIALLAANRETAGLRVGIHLRCLRDIAPREFERNHLDTLAEIADLALRLANRRAELSPEVATTVESLLGFYRDAATVDAVIRHVVERPIGSMDVPGVLLAAGGHSAARRALEWLKTEADPEARARVTAALVGLDAETMQQTVLPGLGAMGRLAETFAAVIDRLEPARAIEVALHLMAHDQADVRLKATRWLLNSSLTSGKRQRVVQRALADDDPRVVQLGVDEAVRLDSALATDALVVFVARRVRAGMLPLQIKAVRAIGGSRGDVASRLGRMLLERRYVFARADRQVSTAIAGVLARSPHADARKAARAWRVSPAGLLSLFTATSAGPS